MLESILAFVAVMILYTPLWVLIFCIVQERRQETVGIIGIGIGNARMGVRRTDKDGNVTSETPARWEPDETGGAVCIWPMNPETMQPDGAAEIFGDWDAAAYLGRALELIKPNRQINVPDLGAMIRAAEKDGFDLCEYCRGINCPDCIVGTWKGESKDE